MYKSQVRPRVVGRALVAHQQPQKLLQGSKIDRSATESKFSLLQSALFTPRRSGLLAIASTTCLVIPFLAGCGVTSNSAAVEAASRAGWSSISQVSCGTKSLTGAQTKGCSVSLSHTAKRAVVVTLTSSNAALQVPSEVTVSAGATSANFNAVSSNVTSAVSVTITGKSDRSSQSSSIMIYPITSASSTSGGLSSISCGTQSLTGNTSETCSISLGGAASSAVAVNLSSSSSALQVPSTATVAQGATTANFKVTASSTSTSQSVTLTASAEGTTQTAVIQLVGSDGQTTAQHKVQLNWQAPTGSVAGYRVYRMTNGSSGYTSLTSSVDTQTSYVDATVQSGLTYDYVVTSVDGSGIESAYSSPTTVTIP